MQKTLNNSDVSQGLKRCMEEALIKKVGKKGGIMGDRKNKSIIWHLTGYFFVALAIPMSFLLLVKIFGNQLESEGVLLITLLLFVVSQLIICVLMIMSAFETKNLLEHVFDRIKGGDYTSRIEIPRGIPKEWEKLMGEFNRNLEKTEKLVHKTKEAIIEQKNAEIAALEAQIDPHFLYNTLDTINWKAIEHEDYEVSNMVGALADILRYTIKNPNAVCSIEQEIYWLEQYIFFQKARLGKELEIIYDVPEELKEYEIHKLILQPFVENSIKHGFPKSEKACVLRIKIRDVGDQIHIGIKDNGVGMDKDLVELYNRNQDEMREHLGIANVCRRLRLYYGDEADLYFESEQGEYTKVHLFIPKRKQLSEENEELRTS